MKNKIKNLVVLIMDNFRLFIPLQIINQMLGVFIIYPISNRILNIAYGVDGSIKLIEMKGFELSLENIGLFLIIFIILGLYYFYQVSSYLILSDALIRNQRLTILEMFEHFMKTIKRNLNKELIKMLVVVSFIMPLSLLALFNAAMVPLDLPEFVLDYLRYSKYYQVGALLVGIVINGYALFLLFVIYDVLIEGLTFKDAHHHNARFIQKHLKTLVSAILNLIIVQLIIAVVYFVTTFILGFVLNKVLVVAHAQIIFNDIHAVIAFLFSMLASIIFITMLSMLVIIVKQGTILDNNKSVSLSKYSFVAARNILGVSVGLALVFSLNGVVNEVIQDVDVVGHRMGTLELPENSMLALESAITNGYDMVEIDVQQLKDKTVLVIHDSNFKRLAGVNQQVSSTTYEEVLEMNPNYTHPDLDLESQKFATFEDVAQRSKDNVKLMIELKTHPKDTEFIEAVMSTINKYDIADQVTLASMDKQLLKDIKNINPDFETTYIATVVIGDKLNDDYIDSYSLQLDLLTQNVIKQIKAQNKDLYVWTPNTSKTISKALKLDIDGIVTDKPELVKFHIRNPNYNVIDEFWNALFFSNTEDVARESVQ